jgi:hypothetical protein
MWTLHVGIEAEHTIALEVRASIVIVVIGLLRVLVILEAVAGTANSCETPARTRIVAYHLQRL